MKILAIIPARMNSTRLPGKPLLKVNGKTIIQHVWDNLQSPLLDYKIIATDDKKILETVKAFNGQAILTKTYHKNGSERCCEVIKLFPEYDLILNIQGDEPMVNEKIIKKLVTPFLKNPQLLVSTLKKKIDSTTALDSNVVKVVTDQQGYALYFSRARIPFIKNESDSAKIQYYKHLGFYGFKKDYLLRYIKTTPSLLENIEKLEQLRILENNHKIFVEEYNGELIDINTIADLQKFKKLSL
jgi:3-deoxy-manno-octulosonate cytidylyltransferase (CMP-KDO synthetase)